MILKNHDDISDQVIQDTEENTAFLDFVPLFIETKVRTPGFDGNCFIEYRLGILRTESREPFSLEV